MQANDKLGLVLSGGGAKGAYQVGILKYMAEIGMQPDEVAGTSIGALNASVLSAEVDIAKTTKVLESIWQELAKISPIQISTTKVLITSTSIILSLIPAAKLNPMVKVIRSAFKIFDWAKDVYAYFSDDYKNSDNYKERLESDDSGILDSEPLIDILATHASADKIKAGLPLYIGVYESDGSGKDSLNYLKHILWGTETKDSEFWHVQSLTDDKIQDAIMASAALPFLFQSKVIDGKGYRDGGVGGSFRQQGNTPIQPLVNSGCNYIIVSLLDDGSPFERHEYPDTTIIEVRPKEFISKSMADMVAFEPEKIETWMEQGYQDAKRCIGNVLNSMKIIKKNELSAELRDSMLKDLDSDDFKI